MSPTAAKLLNQVLTLPLSIAFALLAGGLLAPPVQALKPDISHADLDTPFVLRAGDTVQVGPENFEITLRTISEDSGCMTPKDCSEIVFNGSLAVRLGEKKDLFQVQSILGPDSPLSLDFAGYSIWVTAVHRVDGHLEATLKLVNAPEEKKEDGEDDQ
jgi:hypothetical protein